MDTTAEDDDVLEIDSPMEVSIDLPSEGEEMHPSKDADEGDETIKIRPARGGQEIEVEIPKHLRRPNEAPREQALDYQESLPYPVETLAEMDERLELIVRNLVDCVEARDYDVGFVAWNHRLEMWLSLKYPMKRAMRAKLAKLYWELAVLPGVEPRLTELFAHMCMNLIEPKKRIDIRDMQLDWEPMYRILEKEIFPKQRKTGHTIVFATLLTLTEYAARFFPPHAAPAMLSAFLPKFDGGSLNSILATQAFLCHFLPTSHPQLWRTMIFRLWESFASGIWDDQWLDLISRLSVQHLDPNVSDPRLETWLHRVSEGEDMDTVARELVVESMTGPSDGMDVDPSPSSRSPSPPGSRRPWKGIRQDVGIFTEREWSFIMTKCLRAFGVPVGSASRPRGAGAGAGGSAGGGKAAGAAFLAHSSDAGALHADSGVSMAITSMKKPSEKLASFATLIVYSMSKDGPATPETPSASEMPTPTRGSEVDLPSLISRGGLAPPMQTRARTKRPQTYLGGSKALDSLSKLLQATESFFHPSNYGSWQSKLARFLQNLCWEFVRRWREEEKPDCPTPHEWRLTPLIRREFTLAIRNVALLSMFCKDPLAMASTQQAMRSLAYIEPSLILPPVLERAIPALEGLLETHRTVACISMLATIAMPLVTRDVWPEGAKHLVTILELLLPGIDLNDATKTMSSAMFVLLGVATIKIGDLTGIPSRTSNGDSSNDSSFVLVNGEVPRVSPELGETALTREQQDSLARTSTAALPDWSTKFIRQVLNLFENLPEPGKNNRAGGKMEEQLISLMINDLDFVFRAMDDDVFDGALKRYFDYIATTARTNTVKPIGGLASCFTRAQPKKTFDLLFPFCARNIRYELENGASSTRTTSTSEPASGDLTLHWFSSILSGCVPHAGPAILGHKQEVLDLLKVMVRDCKHERGSTYATRIISSILTSLTNIYTNDMRFVNPDEWESEEMHSDHHMIWGKTYKVKEVKIPWHVPTSEEIDFALQILEEVTDPAIDVIARLLRQANGEIDDKIWKNDFVRHCAVIKASFSGTPALMVLRKPATPGAPVTDIGNTVPGFVDDVPYVEAGISLQPGDPRHSRALAIKQRAAGTIHEAMQRLKDRGADDSIDSVKILISTTRTLLLDYPADRTAYDTHKKAHDFLREWVRTSRSQKSFPRALWVRRATVYQQLRLRYDSLYRRRSAGDDELIKDLCELSLSQYTSVRKTAQRALDLITQSYDGTRTLLFDRLYDNLKPGTDPDRMKGALYVLGSKMFSGLSLQDWRHGPRYISELLQCQHEAKPSIQSLVASLLNDIVIRLVEVSTIRSTLTSSSLDAAVAAAQATLEAPPRPDVCAGLAERAQQRRAQKDEAYKALIPRLLEVASNPNTHWRYSLNATRLLRQLIRRDQPLDPALATFFAKQMIAELPNKRVHSMAAMTKILHFVKLRTLARNDDELLLQQSHNPLKVHKRLPDPLPKDFTKEFIASFDEPLHNASKETLLMDKLSTGWLVWGHDVDFYRVPPATGPSIVWDPASHDALDQLEALFTSESFWRSVGSHFSQEHTRNYLAAENVVIIKSIFQIFDIKPWDTLRPLIEEYLAESDRHKQRAAAEFIGGVLRGSKHWPLDKQDVIWQWFQPRILKIFNSINPDTQPAWEMFADYVLAARDPRRNKPLVEFITGLDLDKDATEAFGPAKAQYLVGCAIRSLSWHFEPWADKFLDLYWSAIDHPYAEVRNAISLNLRSITELRLHPSFPSTEALIADWNDKSGHMAQLISIDEATTHRIDGLVKTLEQARAVRLPAQHGSQTYDKSATTILTWLWSSLNDFRITTVFPFTMKLLPELFKMQELADNPELTQLAKSVLVAISSLIYPPHLVAPTLQTLMDLLRTSDSWRVRLDVLPVLQVFFFHQLYQISEDQIGELLECLCDLLRDPNNEVREAAAVSLSGIVRCSQRRAILRLKDRFLTVIRRTKLPRRRLDQHGEERAGYQETLIAAHSGVLGATALINAFPYEVPSWMPDLLLETLGTHTSSPAPISTTVKKTLADFKKSHQDSWTEDQKAFTEEQLVSLNDLLIGSSYYA